MQKVTFEEYVQTEVMPYRERKAAQWKNRTDMRFFKVSESDLAITTNLLRQMLRKKLANHRKSVTVSLSDYDAAAVLDLLSQLQFAYAHPRSTSLRVALSRENSTPANRKR